MTKILHGYNMVITMRLQTVFRAGNSNVVAIPKELAEELGIKLGQKVFIDKTPDNEGVLIKTTKKVKGKKSRSQAEFKKWLKDVLQEDAKILDELALR